MQTQRDEVTDLAGAVRRLVIQCTTELGFTPVLVTGKRSIMVQYRQPSRMKTLGVIKPVYITVAEIKILPVDSGVCQLVVRPRLYGHDRPRVDQLIDGLRGRRVSGVRLEIVIQN